MVSCLWYSIAHFSLNSAEGSLWVWQFVGEGKRDWGLEESAWGLWLGRASLQLASIHCHTQSPLSRFIIYTKSNKQTKPLPELSLRCRVPQLSLPGVFGNPASSSFPVLASFLLSQSLFSQLCYSSATAAPRLPGHLAPCSQDPTTGVGSAPSPRHSLSHPSLSFLSSNSILLLQV